MCGVTREVIIPLSVVDRDVENSPMEENDADSATNRGSGDTSASIHPNDNDVIAGRGNGIQNGIGNVQFRRLVNERKETYLRAHKSEKSEVAKDIIQFIAALNPPGRFLTMNHDKTYEEMLDWKALEKVKQALREKSNASVTIDASPPSEVNSCQNGGSWIVQSNECPFGKTQVEGQLAGQQSPSRQPMQDQTEAFHCHGGRPLYPNHPPMIAIAVDPIDASIALTNGHDGMQVLVCERMLHQERFQSRTLNTQCYGVSHQRDNIASLKSNISPDVEMTDVYDDDDSGQFSDPLDDDTNATVATFHFCRRARFL